MAEWVNNRLTLIGETHGLNELRMIPLKFRMGDNETHYGMQYIGGLSVGIRFRSESDIVEFLKKEEHWNTWFKSFTTGDKWEFEFERVAWLKIAGLPTALWSEENFSRIVMEFGKILDPLEIISTCQDLSLGGVCVLTRHKRRINEEVKVVLNGNVFGVGVFEAEYDWSPFPSGPFQSIEQYESGDEDDWSVPGDEEDSEQDDYLGSSKTDKEEGEINSEDESDWVPESEASMPESVKNAVAGDTNNDSLMGVDDQTADEVGENRRGNQMPEVGDDDASSGEFQRVLGSINNLQSNDIPRGEFVFNALPSSAPCTRALTKSDFSGRFDGLLKMGAFGPFNSEPNFVNRRILPASLRESNSNKENKGMEMDSSLIKLNEAEITVEVGKLLGIEMEVKDPVLLEALGEAGDLIDIR
ncbi:hypothetical protein L2E82_11774 [Cichorium intybus]|uniref:Uncharacterized protein n=1 Tax=Cichorium intybus TaxID=13427 RepID=A0ACB9GF99_CICIN|nr:hypothetical protein L2E82_11774 [Cichorium intybus]